MAISGLYDLDLTSGTIEFGEDGEPLYLSGLSVISQDLKHRLEDAKILKKLVGARESDKITIFQEIENLVEEDLRVKPGSVSIAQYNQGKKVKISAKSVNDEDIIL